METLFTGQNLIELSACSSVNSHAIELLKSVNLPEGTVIFTPNQTAGRGQRGSSWYSESGKNVAMSLIFFPRFLDVKESFQLSKIVSLGVYDFLSASLPKEVTIRIKWPNDILVNKKKICGILIENILRDERLNASVIGVGLNVNQEFFTEDLHNAVSIKQVIGENFDCVGVIKGLCISIEKWYLLLRRGEKEKIDRTYHELLYLLNQEHEFRLPGESRRLTGQIEGVDSNGRLRVKTVDKEGIRMFDVREIIF